MPREGKRNTYSARQRKISQLPLNPGHRYHACVPIENVPNLDHSVTPPIAPTISPGTAATAAPKIDPGEDNVLHCPGCNYDLRALVGERCPECGVVIDRAALAGPRIPWVLRRNIGWFRAYLQTAWLALAHPRRFAANMDQPVSLGDARSFQNVTVLLAFLPLLGIGLWAYYTQAYVSGSFGARGWLVMNVPHPTVESFAKTLGGALEALGVAFAGFCLWLFLKGATGAASYFFHPRYMSIARQNRAVALSYYACAPLAWTPIFIALSPVFASIMPMEFEGSTTEIVSEAVLVTVILVIAAAPVFAWWRSTLVLLRNTTGCGHPRVLMLAVCLPLMWGLLAVLTLGLLPVAYGFVAIVILSLR